MLEFWQKEGYLVNFKGEYHFVSEEKVKIILKKFCSNNDNNLFPYYHYLQIYNDNVLRVCFRLNSYNSLSEKKINSFYQLLESDVEFLKSYF